MVSTEAFVCSFSENNLPQNAVFTWKSPSNIALVKYWGKTEPQIPKNASISFTLNNCNTVTTVSFEQKEPSENQNIEILFERKPAPSFLPKIRQFIDRILPYSPYLNYYHLKISTENTFPHSSGIASSASGMAALAMCFMSLEKQMNLDISDDYFYQKASFLARLGSGSAARSIKGNLVVWGEHPQIPKSSNLYGIEFPFQVHSNFKDYQDTILLVDKGEKQVSSTVGHNLMHAHPFADNRFKQANQNLSVLSQVLQNGDLSEFIRIVESEALSLHAMMMTSNPYFILMKTNTLQIIEKIWEFRKSTNTHICFTLDAGANVHVLYPFKEKKKVKSFILKELVPFCQKNQYICDRLGQGSELML